MDLVQKVHFFYYNRAVENIRFLYIEECPNAEAAWKNLSASLEFLGVGIQPERILIHDDLEADHFSFQGSPSIQVDGVDLWEQKKDEYHMGCRVYSTPDGWLNSPTTAMLVERLRKIIQKDGPAKQAVSTGEPH